MLASSSGRCSVTDAQLLPPCLTPVRCLAWLQIVMSDGCESINGGKNLCSVAQ